MEHQGISRRSEETAVRFNLGTFEGFNFRTQSAINRVLSHREVIAWDHDQHGEAEFWPAGDRPEVTLIFKDRSAVTGSELLDLHRVVGELGGDTPENFLRIHHAVNLCGAALAGLSADAVEDHNLHVFFGSSFLDLRREAAFELFELYYPEEYRVWEKSLCDGLNFDTDRFLDSPAFFVEEVTLGRQVACLVAPQ